MVTTAKTLSRISKNTYSIKFTNGEVASLTFPDSQIVSLADALGFRACLDDSDLETHLETFIAANLTGLMISDDPTNRDGKYGG